jgi:hypothetical protein
MDIFSLAFVFSFFIYFFENVCVLRSTEIKVAVKFCFSAYHTPFDREFQGGQEYVCFEFSQPFVRSEN